MNMPANSIVKSTAKLSLKGQWSASIAVFSILFSAVFLLYCIESLFLLIFDVKNKFLWTDPLAYSNVLKNPPAFFITLFSSLCFLCLVFPLLLGIVRWFWHITYGVSAPVGIVFHYYSSKKLFLSAINLALAYLLRVIVILVTVFSPSIIVYVLSKTSLLPSLGINFILSSHISNLILPLLNITGNILFLVFIIRYYLAPVLMINNPELSASDAMKLSCKVSRGSRMGYFLLWLNFLGWFLLSLFAVPLLFVFPYFVSATTVFSRYAINTSNRNSNMIKDAQ